jgi:two-component system cell cycle response regulator
LKLLNTIGFTETLKKLILLSYPSITLVGAQFLLSLGAFLEPASYNKLHAGALMVLTGVLLTLMYQRLLPTQESKTALAWHDFELGAMFVTAVQVVVQISGLSSLYPLMYILLAFYSTFTDKRTVAGTLGFLVISEVAHYIMGHVAIGELETVARLSFIGVFSVMMVLFLRAQAWQQKRTHKIKLEAELDGLQQEAHEYRLFATTLNQDTDSATRATSEEKIARESVANVRATMRQSLELLKECLNLHSCVLLLVDKDESHFKIKEAFSDSQSLTHRPLKVGEGILGGIVRRQAPLMLNDLRAGYRGINYYTEQQKLSGFLGVPVFENSTLRGIICADRINKMKFSKSDESMLRNTADILVKNIQNERLFMSIERSKFKQNQFYKASAALVSALTLEEVYEKTESSLQGLFQLDFGAVTLYEQASDTHTIHRVFGSLDYSNLQDETFKTNHSLVSIAVKNRHYLPTRGNFDHRQMVVFKKKLKIKNLQSLLVLPLISKGTAIGALTVGSKESHVFHPELREMLEVITNQIAVSVDNAILYSNMQTMATTDGLTGLNNHRTFQERLLEMMARSKRNGKKLAVLLADIDHFKGINDTHGHPIGDAVLRKVSQILKQEVRLTDCAARYGGEEFVLVLEDTDEHGGKLMAERIRVLVSEAIFASPQGPFRITMSFGLSNWPGPESCTKEKLIEQADQALYYAKNSGRNQSWNYSEIPTVIRSAS